MQLIFAPFGAVYLSSSVVKGGCFPECSLAVCISSSAKGMFKPLAVFTCFLCLVVAYEAFFIASDSFQGAYIQNIFSQFVAFVFIIVTGHLP